MSQWHTDCEEPVEELMDYSARHARQTTVGSAELAGLLMVVSFSVAAFWFVGQRIGLDLAPLFSIPAQLGLYDHVRQVPISGYAPVGRASPAAPAEVAAPPRGETCSSDSAPVFVLGFAELRGRLGTNMGAPVDCEHPTGSNGDTQQRTSTGLAYYSKASNVVAFTNGWRHWALRNGTLVTWDGEESDPPVSADPA